MTESHRIVFMTKGAKLAFLICLIGIGVAGGFVVRQQTDLSSQQAAIRDGRKDTCQRESNDRDALRRLIVFFEGRTLASPTITKREKPQIEAFYNQALRIIPPVNCN